MKTLGNRLKEAREKKRYTQLEVATKLGISNGTLSGYERDYRDPDTDTLRRLASLYEVTTDWLMTGKIKNGDTTNDEKSNESEEEKRPGVQLREYIEQGLTNEQIKQRGDLYVAFLALNDEQANEFLNFARDQIFKNLKQPSAAASKSDEQ